ncbi:MAG TPA: isoprenylcysteine carboxylmethyltransferase family protein [Patescibacteria group bacterium]|nr:isoprenylcysteine carboxylmethyltransferase family protein [Patescibacteria group bacterium]
MLRLLTLALSIAWFILWWFVLYDKKLTKGTKQKEIGDTMSKYTNFAVWGLTMAQLLGVSLLPFSSVTTQWVGFCLVVVGVLLSISARIYLGSNWVPGYLYKKSEHLITNGPYRLMRHPIYTGILLVYIGSELVAQSLLAISFLAFFLACYWQGKREEKILLEHFGKQYIVYQQHTKMLIPFVL